MNTNSKLIAFLSDYPECFYRDIDVSFFRYHALIKEVCLESSGQELLTRLEKLVFDDTIADGLFDVLIAGAFDEDDFADLVLTTITKMMSSTLNKDYSEEEYQELLQQEKDNIG